MHCPREHSTMRAQDGGLPRIVWMQFVQCTRRWGLVLADKAEHWLERSRQRRALRGASDHPPQDNGIGRAEAENEAFQPVLRDQGGGRGAPTISPSPELPDGGSGG